MQEVDILQSGVYRAKTVAGGAVCVDTNLVLARYQVAGKDVKLRLQRAPFVIAHNDLRPYSALQKLERLLGRAFQQQLSRGDDRHPWAKLAHVFHDVCGK